MPSQLPPSGMSSTGPTHWPASKPDAQPIQGALQAYLTNASREQAELRRKLQGLQRENEQLGSRNRQLETEKQKLEIFLREASKARQLEAPGTWSTGSTVTEAPGTWATGNTAAQEEDVPPEAGMKFDDGRMIKIHDMPVHSVAMVPANAAVPTATQFASASWDASVKFYDMTTDQVVQTFSSYGEGPEDKMQGIYAVSFAKTEPQVFGCTSCDHSVYLWSTQTGKLLRKMTGHKDEVNGIDFHSQQMVMCTASDDCSAIIWDFQEGKELRKLDKHNKAVYGATFMGSEHQYLCATCDFDAKARIWDIRDKQLVAMVNCGADDVIGIDFSGQQSILATGSDDGLICGWDSKTWKSIFKIDTRLTLKENEVKRVKWSPCGMYIAAACSSHRVLVYKYDRNRSAPPSLCATLEGHTDCVFDIAWGKGSSGKNTLVSASHDHTSRIWTEVDLSGS